MPERNSVFQKIQIGVEVTKGTPVAATRILTATQFTMGPKFDVKMFRASGYRFPTVEALGKEWVEAQLEGPLTYSGEIVYWLSSAIKTVTPSTASGATTWTFDMSSNAVNTTKAYTVEMGSAERAHKFSYGQLTGIGMSFSRDECKLTGSMIGKAFTDAITMTTLTGTAEMALIPVMPTEVSIKLADTAAGLAGATALTRGFAVDFSLDKLTDVIYPLNASTTWTAEAATVPDSSVSLLVEADSEGMALLSNVRTGATKFLRIGATGKQIGAGPATYALTIDMAVQFTGMDDFQDEQGVFAAKWNGALVHDKTFDKALTITVVNETPGL